VEPKQNLKTRPKKQQLKRDLRKWPKLKNPWIHGPVVAKEPRASFSGQCSKG